MADQQPGQRKTSTCSRRCGDEAMVSGKAPAWSVALVRGSGNRSRCFQSVKQLSQHCCHSRRQCCPGNGLGSHNQQGRRIHERRRFCVAEDDQVFTLGVRNPHAAALDTKYTVGAILGFWKVRWSSTGMGGERSSEDAPCGVAQRGRPRAAVGGAAPTSCAPALLRCCFRRSHGSMGRAILGAPLQGL